MVKERSLFANSAWGVIANTLRAVIGFIFMPIVLYYLGIVGFGLYSIIMLFSFYQGLASRTDLGYASFLVKHLSRFSHDKVAFEFEKQVSGFFLYLISIQLVLAVAFFFTKDFWIYFFQVPVEFKSDFAASILIIFTANIFSAGVSLYSAYLAGQHRNVFIKKADTCFFLIFNILAISFLSISHNLLSIAIAFLISQFASFMVFIYVAREVSFFRMLFSRLSLNSYKLNWYHWRPFFFANLTGVASRQSDTTILSFILGPQGVAAYEICLKLPAFVKSSAGRLSEVLVPFSSSHKNKANDKFMGDLLYNTIFLSVAVSLCLIVGVGVYGDKILFMWLGEGYSNLHKGFLIACFIPLFVAASSAPGAVFFGRDNRIVLMTWGPTVMSVINILLSIPLTLYWGFEGTLFGTVIQFLLYAIILMKPLKEDFSVSIFKMVVGWLKILFVMGIAYIVFYPLKKYEFSQLGWFFIFVVMHVILGLIFFGLNRRMILDLRAMMTRKASKALN